MRNWTTILAALALVGCSSGGGEGGQCALLTGDRQLQGGLQGASQVQIETRFVAVDDNFLDQIGVDFDLRAPIMLDDGGALGGRGVTNQPIAVDSNALGGPDGIPYLVPDNHVADSFLGFLNLNFVAAFGDVKVFMQLAALEAAQCIEFDPSILESTTGYPGVDNMNLAPRDPGLLGDDLAWESLDAIQLDQILQNLGNDANNQIIAAPRLTVLDGQRASIMVDDLAINPTDLINEFRNRVEQNVASPFGTFTGPTLDVRPFVVPGTNEIRLEIRVGTQAASFFRSVAFDVNGTQADHEVPVVRVSRNYTQVTIPDGMTLAIGGLVEQGQTDVQQGVPLLGDIPVIGDLFGTGKIGSNQMTLLVFVTPRIVMQDE